MYTHAPQWLVVCALVWRKGEGVCVRVCLWSLTFNVRIFIVYYSMAMWTCEHVFVCVCVCVCVCICGVCTCPCTCVCVCVCVFVCICGVCTCPRARACVCLCVCACTHTNVHVRENVHWSKNHCYLDNEFHMCSLGSNDCTHRLHLLLHGYMCVWIKYKSEWDRKRECTNICSNAGSQTHKHSYTDTCINIATAYTHIKDINKHVYQGENS